MRHPREIGCLLWFLVQVWTTMVSVLRLTVLRTAGQAQGGMEDTICLLLLYAEATYWGTLLVIIFSSGASARHTFFDPSTGRAYDKRMRWDAGDVDKRVYLLSSFDYYCTWKHYEDEVGAWVDANWGTWLAQPDDYTWFTQDVVDRLPRKLLSQPLLDAMSQAPQVPGQKAKSRKDSLLDALQPFKGKPPPPPQLSPPPQ